MENKVKEKQQELEILKDKHKLVTEQKDHRIKALETLTKKLEAKIQKREVLE